MLSRLDTQPNLVYLGGCAIAAIIFLLVSSRLASQASPASHPADEKRLQKGRSSASKSYSRVIASATLAVTVALLLLHISSSNQLHRHLTGDPLIPSGIIDYLDDLRTDWGIPGVSIAIVQGDETGRWKKQTIGLGSKDVQGNPVTDRTLFSLASNSKLFTSIASGLALSEANLKWETPVRSVFPEFQLIDKQAEVESTFIELLSHQTGLPRHDLSYDANVTKSQLISTLRYLKPSAAFKSHWQYNNIAYTIASHLPQQLLGQSFDSFVLDRLWKPLGMSHTYYDHVLANSSGHLSSGIGRSLPSGHSGFLNLDQCRNEFKHSRRFSAKCRGQEVDMGWYQEHWQPFAGAGGVITCSRDMTVWLQTLLAMGSSPSTGEQVIPASIIEATIQPRLASMINPTDPETTVPYYGLAQSIYNYRGHRVIEHGGDVPGQKSQVIRLPDQLIGLAIMVNDEQLGDLYHAVAKWRIIDQLLGLEPIDFRSRKLGKMLDDAIPKSQTARPDRPRPPSDGFDSIPGTYSHPAYGPLNIRPVRPDETGAQDQYSVRTHESSPPSFVADINKSWAKQIIFTHFDGDAFNVTTKYITSDTKTVLWNMNGPATRACFGEGGVGLEKVWGAGQGVPDGDMRKNGIVNGSEVFFSKL